MCLAAGLHGLRFLGNSLFQHQAHNALGDCGDLQKGTPGHGLGLLSQLFQGHPWWETSLVGSEEAQRLLSRKGHIIVSAADPGHPFIFSFFFLSSDSNFPDESMERSICSQTPEPQWQQVDDIGWALMREG